MRDAIRSGTQRLALPLPLLETALLALLALHLMLG